MLLADQYRSIVGLFIGYCFTSHSRIFHSDGEVSIASNWLQNRCIRCLTGKGFFLIVPCMLWNLTSVLWSYQEPIPSLQTNVWNPHTLLPNLEWVVQFGRGFRQWLHSNCRVLIRTEVMMSIEAHLLVILHLSNSTKKGGEKTNLGQNIYKVWRKHISRKSCNRYVQEIVNSVSIGL